MHVQAGQRLSAAHPLQGPVEGTVLRTNPSSWFPDRQIVWLDVAGEEFCVFSTICTPIEEIPMTATTNTAATEAPAKRKPGRPKKVQPEAEAAPVVEAAPVDFKVLAAETRAKMGARVRSRTSLIAPDTAEEVALPPIGSRVLVRLHDSDGDLEAPFEAIVKSHLTERQQSFSGIENAVLTVEDPAHGTNDVRADEVTLLEMLAEVPGDTEVSAPLSTVTSVLWSQIHPSSLNPRKKFDDEALRELALDIRAKGMLQNAVVRPHPSLLGEYEIAAGERRWRAVRLVAQGELTVDGAALPAVPDFQVPILIREMTDRELLEVATAENVQRRRMTPMEEADAFAAIAAQGATPAEIAHKFGYAERTVTRRIQIAQNLTPKSKEAFDAGKLTLGQAEIIALAPPAMQDSMVKEAGWRKVDDLKAALVRGAFLLRHARFDPAVYSGQVVEDLFGDVEPYFHDSKQALALQLAHVEAQAAREVEEGAAFSKVIAHGGSYYNLSYEYPKREGATGTVHLIDTRTGEVTTEQQRTTREDAGLPLPRAAVAQYGWASSSAAKKIREAVLENALFGNPRMALAIQVLDSLSDYDGGLNFVDPEPAVLDFCAELSELTNGVLTMGDEHTVLTVGCPPADEADEEDDEQDPYEEAVVLRALLDLPEESFMRLVTLHACARTDLSGSGAELGSHVALTLGLDLKGRVLLSAELLKDVNHLGLEEIAREAGLDAEGLDEAGLRKRLLAEAKTLNDRGFVPSFVNFPAVATD